MPTEIYSDNGFLNMGGMGCLATLEEFDSAPRDIGSIFEVLKEGESVRLKEGVFLLNGDLDPQQQFPKEYNDLRDEIVKGYGINVWQSAERILSPSDWGTDGECEWWVSLSGYEPGAGNYPCLVFNTQSCERGSAVASTYRPI